MKALTVLAILLLVPFAAQAAQTAFEVDVDCDGTVAVGTGCLKIESSLTSFTKLRDALTPNWDGTLTCSPCNVASGFPGCTTEGDVVATTQKKAALAQLICVLRSHVVQADLRSAVETAAGGVDTNPDIGGGDPQ